MSPGASSPSTRHTPGSPEDPPKSSIRDESAGSPASPTNSKTGQEDHGEAKKKGGRTLTSSQLAKKRANDREAQRAIRERTKHQIKTLEQRIRELESDAPYRQREAALREKEAVQRENEELKRKLDTILDVIRRPSSSETNGEDSALVSKQHKLEISSPALSSTAPSSIVNSCTFASPVALNNNLESRQSVSSVPSSPLYIVSPTSPMDVQPAYAQIPKNIPPTNLHDKILADFVTEIRQHVANGADVFDLLGPPCPDFTSLLYPDKRDLKNPLSLSALLIDILKAFTHISAIPVKVAAIANLYNVVRWFIAPSYEHYNIMPEYLRPVHTQVQIPHPMWVDFLPWPKMRFKMVHNYPSLSLDDFFIPYTVSLSVNWPYKDLERCLYHDQESDTIRMTPEFRNHVAVLENWSLGPTFAEAIPLLADTARIERRSPTTA